MTKKQVKQFIKKQKEKLYSSDLILKHLIDSWEDEEIICECSIPKKEGGEEYCRNKATYKCILTEDFDNDECYWCDECIEDGKDMIESKEKL